MKELQAHIVENEECPGKLLKALKTMEKRLASNPTLDIGVHREGLQMTRLEALEINRALAFEDASVYK